MRHLLILIAVILTVAGAQIASGCQERFGPYEVSGQNSQEPSDPYEIVWVGDILLADAVQPYLDEYGYTWSFEYVQSLLEGDFAVGNAEGPITEHSQPYFKHQRWSYNARPEAAEALADAGFDALGLSNNHAYDRGPEGLSDTIRHLKAAGIEPLGAGMDRSEAAVPLLVETPYGLVAVLALSERGSSSAVAGPEQPGTVPLTEKTIMRGKELSEAASARWTIAYVHWGKNYSSVTDNQRRLAASFAEAGYDLVLGHHPHVQQEVEVVNGMPVLYSLGNFTFGSKGRFTEEFPGYGLVARTLLEEDGFAGIELRCILTDNDFVRYQPRPYDEEQAREVIEGLGPLVVWQDGTGLMKW